MATTQINASNFSLASSWTAVAGNGNTARNTSGPTTGSTTVNFTYSLPTGSTIKSSSVWATLGSPLSGIGSVKANGVSMNKVYNSERGANVTLSGTSGTLSVKFEFTAQGGLAGNRLARLSFSSVYLWIEYDEGSGDTSTSEEVTNYSQSEQMLTPPQSVCLYDHENGHVYLFDGVTKVQHNLSVDIQEEPSKKKEQYVNSARNQPDKVTLDVVMSDVFSGTGAIYDDAPSFTSAQKKAFEWTREVLLPPYMNSKTWSRSQNAFYTMHYLKYERRKLSVITPHYVYTDMIIASVTGTYDDTCPYGLIMQIELQGAYEVTTKKNNTSSTSQSTEEQRVAAFVATIQSSLVSGFNNIFGGGNK